MDRLCIFSIFESKNPKKKNFENFLKNFFDVNFDFQFEKWVLKILNSFLVQRLSIFGESWEGNWGKNNSNRIVNWIVSMN